MENITVKAGELVEVVERELDYKALEDKIATLRDIAATHTAEADALEAKLKESAIAEVVTTKKAEYEAELAAKALAEAEAKALAEAPVEEAPVEVAPVK